jgi:hypothetical protein
LVLGQDHVPLGPLQVQAFIARPVTSVLVLRPQFLVQLGSLLQAVPSPGAGLAHTGSVGPASMPPPVPVAPPVPLPPVPVTAPPVPVAPPVPLDELELLHPKPMNPRVIATPIPAAAANVGRVISNLLLSRARQTRLPPT